MAYMTFIEMQQEPNRKTKQWYISNNSNKAILGYVLFFPQWRKYVFIPNKKLTIIFNNKCLLEIVEFLDKINQERKENLKTLKIGE